MCDTLYFPCLCGVCKLWIHSRSALCAKLDRSFCNAISAAAKCYSAAFCYSHTKLAHAAAFAQLQLHHQRGGTKFARIFQTKIDILFQVNIVQFEANIVKFQAKIANFQAKITKFQAKIAKFQDKTAKSSTLKKKFNFA